MNGNIEDFKKELGELLKKYNVDICVDLFCEDGNDIRITVDTYNKCEEHFQFNGCCIDYKDLLSENK